MSENEYFLDSRMCWMASCTAGSIPWLMLLIRADSFMGIRTMMGKFSPSLANQLLSCPCLVRSLHTLARAGWNSKTERSRHPVGRSISQPLQSLRAGAMRPCRGDQTRSRRNPSLFGHRKFGLVRDAQTPARQGNRISKQSRRESRSSPCSEQTSRTDYDRELREKKIKILLYNSDWMRIFQGRRDSRRRASASRCPSPKRSPLKTAPLIQPPSSPFIWLHHF